MRNDTPFERQIGIVLDRMGGSEPPFDAMAIARTAGPSPKRRLQTMFSTTRFLVAGAVVALFGGFLLAGVQTTQPSDEQTPAVGASASTSFAPEATASVDASPVSDHVDREVTTVRSDLLPGVDLVTEEVEPGVSRVVSDGVRDLDWVTGDVYGGGDVLAGPDGTVWSFRDTTFFRVADEATFAKAADMDWDDIDADDQGRLWAADARDTSTSDPGGGDLMVFDGRSWSVQDFPSGQSVRQVEVTGDGSVWAMSLGAGRATVARLDGGVWRIQGALDGVADARGSTDLSVSDSGDVWVGLHSTHDDALEDLASRIGEPDQFRVGAAPDGTVWVRADRQRLYRYDPAAQAIMEYDSTAGVPNMYAVNDAPGLFHVARDGSLWVTGTQRRSFCDGVSRFDGTTWSHYLAGQCVFSLDSGPDGSLWLQAASSVASDGSPTISTYVIRPSDEPRERPTRRRLRRRPQADGPSSR